MQTNKEILIEQLNDVKGKTIMHYIRFLEKEYARYTLTETSALNSFCAKLDEICGIHKEVAHESATKPIIANDAHAHDLNAIDTSFSKKIASAIAAGTGVGSVVIGPAAGAEDSPPPLIDASNECGVLETSSSAQDLLMKNADYAKDFTEGFTSNPKWNRMMERSKKYY